jgi:hypothetical protein
MDNFFVTNSDIVVLAITLICWVGLFFYLRKLEKKLEKLEK